jgi:hypothetical protein
MLLMRAVYDSAKRSALSAMILVIKVCIARGTPNSIPKELLRLASFIVTAMAPSPRVSMVLGGSKLFIGGADQLIPAVMPKPGRILKWNSGCASSALFGEAPQRKGKHRYQYPTPRFDSRTTPPRILSQKY